MSNKAVGRLSGNRFAACYGNHKVSYGEYQYGGVGKDHDPVIVHVAIADPVANQHGATGTLLRNIPDAVAGTAHQRFKKPRHYSPPLFRRRHSH
jgi:hypothetical protein